MKILKKRPELLYLLCLAMVLAPALHVWFNFPDVKSKDEEEAGVQVLYISLLSFIPFLSVLAYILYRKLSK